MKSITKLQNEALKKLRKARQVATTFVCQVPDWTTAAELHAKFDSIEKEIGEFGKRHFGIGVPPPSLGDAS